MKTITRLVCLALTFALAAMMLASCGGGAAYTANNTEYFIGGTGPLTGDASSYGISANNGAMLAIEELNANGGLNGVKFHYEMKDDTAAAEPAATGFNALYEAGMQISIGSVTSASCASFGDLAVENNVLFMTPSASDAKVIAKGDVAFRVCFGDPQQGTIAADTLTVKYAKIGVIYDTSDTYSSGLYDAFEAEMTVLGKAKDTDYVVRTFDAESNKDFSTQVSALQEAGCDVMVLPMYYTEAGLIAKAAASKGFNVPILGSDGLDGVAGQIAGSNVTASIEYISPFDVNSKDETIAAFVAAYEAKYGVKPDQFAADGYDAVMILFAAMQKAGVNDVTMSASDMTNLVKPVLTSADFSYTGITGKMTWTPDGSCNKDPIMVKVN